MGSDKTNRFPTPTTGPTGETQMNTNLDAVRENKNPSASWADDADYVLAQAKTWIATITPT